MSSQTVSTKLVRLAEQSRVHPDWVFTNLVHHLDIDFLEEAFRRLRKNAAPGIDGETKDSYAEDLEANIAALLERLRSGRYRAQPAKRVWIDKPDGSKRPLAILVFEDKIVQKAVAMLLEAIYEPMFQDFSYGFRPGRSPQQALTALRESCLANRINWLIDADIKSFFDRIPHDQLMAALKRRVNDGALIRLIGKWLHVGVMDDGAVRISDEGTPQGGVISPLLANIYLHTVLDDWFVDAVCPRATGACFLIRFADDFVLGFVNKTDAERVFAVLPRRFEKYGLTIHPVKSRMIQFNRPYRREGKGPGCFDFLGFTHYWARTRRGKWTIRRKTKAKSLRRFMTGIWDWCRDHRHTSLPEQHQTLCAKLRGHYAYYAVSGNYKMLEAVYEHARQAWRRWLGRRSRNGYIKWERFTRYYEQRFPLPKPRILHAL